MMDKIIDTTCSVFGITRYELFSRNRMTHVADARCIAIELVMSQGLMYQNDLCNLFKRHRTTFIASRKKFSLLYGSEKSFTFRYDEIVKLITQSDV